MSRYIMILEIEDAFYQEFHEQGTTKDKLLEELKGDIEDQLDEYDFRRLMTHMVSSESQRDAVIFAPKKSSEKSLVSQLPLVRQKF